MSHQNMEIKPSKQFIFSGHELLLIKNGEDYHIPEFAPENIGEILTQPQAMGFYHQHACYVSEMTKPAQSEPNQVWLPLKVAVEHLGLPWFGAVARAYQVINWEKNHRFCGRCGQPTSKMPQGFERRCEPCKLFFFPRISPSIIVMVRKNEKILLARQARFAPGIYALIAGFVEVGESLEEAIHREVQEEVGISVKNIRYFGSQPWPFPDSLMLAFTADYAAGEIDLSSGELEAAGWYDAKHLPGLPASKISISRQLIDYFLSEYVIR